MAGSKEVIAAIRDKASKWQAEKEKELLRQVFFLKHVTTRSNKLSSQFLDNTYIDVVNQLDNIKGLK
tara:strand:+ start:350 stop:550 length:201 start_codon:yes stop_codon:yes gene_type:complete